MAGALLCKITVIPLPVPAGGGTFLSADKKVPKEAAIYGEALN